MIVPPLNYPSLVGNCLHDPSSEWISLLQELERIYPKEGYFGGGNNHVVL